MIDGQTDPTQGPPPFYYKTKGEIEAYRKRPIDLKLQRLEAQMEFFHTAMSDTAKKRRDKFRAGDI